MTSADCIIQRAIFNDFVRLLQHVIMFAPFFFSTAWPAVSNEKASGISEDRDPSFLNKNAFDLPLQAWEPRSYFVYYFDAKRGNKRFCRKGLCGKWKYVVPMGRAAFGIHAQCSTLERLSRVASPGGKRSCPV